MYKVGPGVVMWKFDINTISLDELKAVMATQTVLPISQPVIAGQGVAINGLLGWFDTDFKGSEAFPAAHPVLLTTQPTTEGATHWGQQCFHVLPEIPVVPGDKLHLDWSIKRQKQNERLIEFHAKAQLEAVADGKKSQVREMSFRLD